MICFTSKLPILQVGSQQIRGYDTDWLHRAIMDGLNNAEIKDVKIAHDIYQGVLYYLQNDCPWSLLKIEDLYQKVQNLLSKVGLDNVRNHLPLYCPEIRISVAEVLTNIDCPMEIALIKSLHDEISNLQQYGAERIILEEIEEAVTTLIPAKRWTKKKQYLHDEIASLSEPLAS